jgi:hypothetical protein
MHVQQAAISAPPIRIEGESYKVRHKRLFVANATVERPAIWHDLLAFR